MKQELALVKGTVNADPKAPTAPSRKELREATDKVIHDALLIDDLPGLVQTSAETMLTVATVLTRYEQDPDVRDFVEAAQAHIEHGRAVMDRGLMIDSMDTVRCGAVMIELTVRGVCAAVSAPYDTVLAAVHRAQQTGEKANMRAILGLKDEPATFPQTIAQAANDAPDFVTHVNQEKSDGQ